MSDYLKDSFEMSGLNDALNDEEPKRPVEPQPMKLDGLVGMPADVLESLPLKVRRRVECLRAMQSHYDVLEARYYEERLALEAKYLKIYQPYYARRSDIVNGAIEVDGTVYEPSEEQEDDPVGIPEFWLFALKNNDVLAELITEQDEEALVYLNDIKWYRIQDPKGFTIEFIFDENPYFKNAVLTKTYYVVDEDEPVLNKAIGTEIEWYPGKCLTQNVQKKKPKKGLKPVTNTEESGSFFSFFTSPEVPADDIPLNEETAAELQDVMEEDYEIAITIRDKIIPHAVSWFTGEAATGYDFGIFVNDDDSDISLDDDTDDDEEDKFEDVQDANKLDGGAAQ